MKNLLKSLGIFLGLVFLSVSVMATTVDPPTVEKIEAELNMRIYTGDICKVAIAECCEDFIDFSMKKNNALKVLKSGCDEVCVISEAGEYKFYDYIDRDNKKVARLVINENKKILMLITHEFKNYK